MKKRYDCGELITKDNLTDELWAADYANFLENYTAGDSIEDLYQRHLAEYRQQNKIEHPNKEQILRWSTHLIERLSNMKYLEKEEKGFFHRFFKNKDKNELTDQQVENWREVLYGLIGVVALRLTRKEIQQYHDVMQQHANALGELLKKDTHEIEIER